MSDKNLQLKYDILKARIANLIEEHADALALAQNFKNDLDRLNEQFKQAEKKIFALEGALNTNDIQKKEPKVTIIDKSVATAEDKT